MKEKRLIFYDFEVFKEDWLVVFIDYNSKKKLVIVNDRNKLTNFYLAAKDCIFVGFNSRNYDSTIFKAIILGLNPHRVSVDLVERGKKQYQVLPREHKNIQLYNYDIADGFKSLKQYEAFMGDSIEESSIPFDIQRKLTPDEIKETIKYCTHDVEETIKVFEYKRKLNGDFDAEMGLIKLYNLDMEYINKTKTQLASIVLKAKKPSEPRNDDFDIYVPDCLTLNKYKYIEEWFLSDEFKTGNAKLKTDVWNMKCVFGMGGVHGSIEKEIVEGIIMTSDVASLYPSIMIQYNLLSRNVANPKDFEDIRDLRVRYKHEKNPLQASLKLTLNSTYGGAKDQYNQLYDFRNATLVCVFGQLLMVQLIEDLENVFGDKARIIDVNTDGIMVLLQDESQIEVYNQVIKEWELKTRLEMETEIKDKIIKNNVNNYILIGDGKVKSKGSVVKKNTPIDNDLSIINDAVREYYVNGTPLEDTIYNCNDLTKFQKVYKTTSNYVYAVHGTTPVHTKVNRVFASKDTNDGAFYKLKKDKETPDKFANTPDHVFIDNGDIKNKPIPDKLDREWYIQQCINEIKKFTKEIYQREEN